MRGEGGSDAGDPGDKKRAGGRGAPAGASPVPIGRRGAAGGAKNENHPEGRSNPREGRIGKSRGGHAGPGAGEARTGSKAVRDTPGRRDGAAESRSRKNAIFYL